MEESWNKKEFCAALLLLLLLIRQVLVWVNTQHTHYIIQTGIQTHRCAHQVAGALGRPLKIDLFGEMEVVGGKGGV